MKDYKFYAVSFVAILLLLSCHTRSVQESFETFVIEDMQKRKVCLPGKIERIVCLRPGALRLLVYMDVTDKIVGIEQVETGGDDRPYMLAHPELLSRPFIGPRGGDVELILNVHPDVIFMTYASKAEADALQEKIEIPVVLLEYPEMGMEIEALYASLKLIGEILHKEERADSLASYIQETISDLYSRTAGIDENDKPDIYIGGIAHGRTRDITSTHPLYPPFKFINAKNVAGKINMKEVSSLAGIYIDVEQLLLWNPDVIFVDESGIALVRENLKAGGTLMNLTAVRTNRIFTLPAYNSYAANYETGLINSWFIGKTLYPDVFADIVMEEKANEILNIFVGQPNLLREIVSPHSFKPVSSVKFND